MSAEGSRRRYDVALSYAGAQREYVEQVAKALKARGVSCFYDIDEQAPLWGKDLVEELPSIYERESRVVVVFISAEYVERAWTRLEFRAALNRAVKEPGVYVLPARFDNSEIPGLLPGVVFVDLRSVAPRDFADRVAAKLAELDAVPLLRAGDARKPPGGIRVREADPRQLGVHAVSILAGH